jgi:hypothetical protein
LDFLGTPQIQQQVERWVFDKRWRKKKFEKLGLKILLVQGFWALAWDKTGRTPLSDQ